MTMIERPRVLLSVQALLGVITPQVRVVDVFWDASQIMVRFVVDGEVEARLSEDAVAVESEVLADFIPCADVSVCVVRIDKDLPVTEFAPWQGGETAVVFARREEGDLVLF